MNRGGAEREGDTESETGSRLWAVSTEPKVGLEPMDREIMTWAEVRRLTDQATQAPLVLRFQFAFLWSRIKMSPVICLFSVCRCFCIWFFASFAPCTATCSLFSVMIWRSSLHVVDMSLLLVVDHISQRSCTLGLTLHCFCYVAINKILNFEIVQFIIFLC